MSAAGAGAGRRITVRSVSCRGVKSFVPFQKPPLYAAVSLGGRREKTPADPDGGENPDWDGAVFAFHLDGGGSSDGLLQFELKAQVPLLGNKLVGAACVPVADLGGGDGEMPRHVSYQVCAPDGKPNGTLSFAYAITGGGSAYQQPQLYPAPNGKRPEHFCCPPPPQPSTVADPAPPMPNLAPHNSSYPPPPSPSPPVSTPLYPPLQDLLPSSSYPAPPPPPPMMDSQFPAPNFPPNSSYPPPPALAAAYPPPPASYTTCSVPPAQYISSYPPPPPLRSYPPPTPISYPPLAPMNPELPASNFFPANSSYPPPESGSKYPVLPRSTPSSLDRALRYTAPPSAPSLQSTAITYQALAAPPQPSGGSYYPSPGTRHPQEAVRTPYYYPPPGTRYS